MSSKHKTAIGLANKVDSKVGNSETDRTQGKGEEQTDSKADGKEISETVGKTEGVIDGQTDGETSGRTSGETPLNALDAEKPQQKVDKRSVSWIKPGQVLNPGGRPKGSLNRLQGDFMWELADSFAKHGKSVIEAVIAEKPHEFLKICASLMPKQLEITTTALDEMSLEQLEESLDTLRRLSNKPEDVIDVIPK